MNSLPSDEATSRLLVDHLDPARFGHPGYLGWFYRDNPRGEVIDENEDDDDGNRIAHYAVIPTRYRTPAGTTPFIFSSNVATSPAIRRGGLFRTMADPSLFTSSTATSSLLVWETNSWFPLPP